METDYRFDSTVKRQAGLRPLQISTSRREAPPRDILRRNLDDCWYGAVYEHESGRPRHHRPKSLHGRTRSDVEL